MTTEIRVEPGSTVIVTGPAVIHIGPPEQHTQVPEAGPSSGSRPAHPELAEAVSLVAAYVHGMPAPSLSGDVPPAAVVAMLGALLARFIIELVPLDRRTSFLEALGLAAQDGTV